VHLFNAFAYIFGCILFERHIMTLQNCFMKKQKDYSDISLRRLIEFVFVGIDVLG